MIEKILKELNEEGIDYDASRNKKTDQMPVDVKWSHNAEKEADSLEEHHKKWWSEFNPCGKRFDGKK